MAHHFHGHYGRPGTDGAPCNPPPADGTPCFRGDNIFANINPGNCNEYEYDIPAVHSPGIFWWAPAPLWLPSAYLALKCSVHALPPRHFPYQISDCLDTSDGNKVLFWFRMHPHHHGSGSLQTQTASLPVIVDTNPASGWDYLATPSCQRFQPLFQPQFEVIMHMQVCTSDLDRGVESLRVKDCSHKVKMPGFFWPLEGYPGPGGTLGDCMQISYGQSFHQAPQTACMND